MVPFTMDITSILKPFIAQCHQKFASSPFGATKQALNKGLLYAKELSRIHNFNEADDNTIGVCGAEISPRECQISSLVRFV